MTARDSTLLHVLNRGRKAYAPTLALQEKLVEQRRVDAIPDTLILVEHDPVYTLGRNAREEHVLLSRREMRRQGIELFRTSRGGDVTYHGPGQIVGYPILDLKRRRMGVVQYVDSLEKVILGVLEEFGIHGSTDRRQRGVWINDNKIAALGVRITRYVTMHGFCLNVRTELGHYRGIIPCGIHDKGVTSLDWLVPSVTMERVQELVIRHFVKVFGYTRWEAVEKP